MSAPSTPKRAHTLIKDFVCVFQQSQIVNFDDVELSEHPGSTRQQREFSVMNTGNENLKVIGTKQDDDGEYVVAIVNRRTGQTEFRPVDMFNFSAQYATDMDVRLGEKRQERINYSEDGDTNIAPFSERKNELSSSFGSARANKMLERMKKRQLKDGTMDELQRTAFASNSVLASTNYENDHTKITAISKEEVSQVLPSANMEASFGREVYALSLFASDAEIEVLQELCEGCLDQKYTDFKREDGENFFPICYKHVLDGTIKDKKMVAYHTLCAGMLYILQGVAKLKMTKQVINDSPLPIGIIDFIQNRYFAAEKKLSGGARGFSQAVSKIEFEKLLAHTLALAMTLDSEQKIYSATWAAYIKISQPRIDKTAAALGASKEETPNSLRFSHGRFAWVLRGPPQPKHVSSKRMRR